MSTKFEIDKNRIKAFDKSYDTVLEDIAAHTRGEFLSAFPINKLHKIKLDDYVIGLQRPTFCTYVEVKTRPWASIQGATSEKFGIYFGKIKSDQKKIYRFARKFGETQKEAFKSIKSALLTLIKLAQEPNLDFKAIDANPLSPMFKAKILSLYFPDRFLNVCSPEHLAKLGNELGYGEKRSISEYQYLLLQQKHANTISKNWSNPKFMAFLYANYAIGKQKTAINIKLPRKKVHRKINFEDIQNQRDRIGKAAETFALEWEKKRLYGANLGKLVSKIKDRRDRPGFGYDFLSFTSDNQMRLIEVKSVGKLPKAQGYRFYLSDNERVVSNALDHQDNYYFYMVFFDGKQTPIELRPILANELYQVSELLPASYVVSFDIEKIKVKE